MTRRHAPPASSLQGRVVVLAFAGALVVSACGSAVPPSGAATDARPPGTSPTAERPLTPSATPAGPAVTAGGPATAPPTPLQSSALPGSTGGAATPGPGGTDALDWTDCGAPFECATLQVPLDYANPGGRTISLALIRLPVSNPSQRVGALVTNPGGPGGSGVDFVRGNAESIYSADLRAHFDIVGFDPRGVGASTPVECLNGVDLDRLNALDPTPDTPAEVNALIAGAKEFDAACENTAVHCCRS